MLCKVIRIMEMNDSCFMCIHNLLWKKETSCNILTYLSCHIIPLHTVHCRVLIGIFLLYILIIILDQRKDPVIRRIGFTDKRSLITVSDIALCQFKSSCRHDLVLYHILDLFYRYCTVQLIAFKFNILGNILDLTIT